MKSKPKFKKRGWYTGKLEEIAKNFAKERDGYICQKTKQFVDGSNAHASHVIPKSLGLRFLFDIRNMKCLSYHSHINWWHKDPVAAEQWLKSELPVTFAYTESIRGETLDISTASLAEFYELAKHCKTWQEYQSTFDSYMKPYIKESK